MNRYITVKGLRVIREFDGKRYQLVTHTIDTRKRDTIKAADSYRKRGYLARIVPLSSGYALYIRKDTMKL